MKRVYRYRLRVAVPLMPNREEVYKWRIVKRAIVAVNVRKRE